MQILKDSELYLLIVGSSVPLVNGLTKPSDWFDASSPIQPASVDLSVGEIYLPPKDRNIQGASYTTETDCILNTGQTAIVVTKESLHLPGDIAAIGFPPSHVSINGILMTNPGHVDPGYEGAMHLTLINMGAQPFPIRKGDAIVTVLFSRLAGSAQADFKTRYGASVAGSQADKALKLSYDFVDVENRATKIASEQVVAAERQVKVWTVWAGIAVACITLVGGLISNYVGAAHQIALVRQELTTFEQQTKTSEDQERRIIVIENELKTLEGKK